MGAPWEKYQAQDGPWSKFKKTEQPQARTWQDDLKDEFSKQSGFNQALIGAGTALSNVIEGTKQLFGGDADKDTIEANKVFAKEAPVSALAGNVALAAPTAMIPGANTVAGAGVIGAGLGLLNPVDGENVLEGKIKNAAIGGAFGGLAQKGANAISDKLLADATAKLALKSKNAARDATIQEAVDAGYRLTPAVADGGALSRIAQSVSGKIKTNQAAQVLNQDVTDSLARKAVGLADDSPLTPEILSKARADAAKVGYEPVKKSGMVQVDDVFKNDLQRIIDKNVTAARDFGDVADDPVLKVAQDVGDKVLSTGAFDAESGLAKVALLREAADKAYRGGDATLGKANKSAATALEDLIERSLQSKGKQGQKMLEQFREARKLMAKTYTVEGALEGSKVNAAKIGAKLQKGKPLSDELLTIGKFNNEFKDLARVPNSGAELPFSPLDYYAGAGAGSLAALASGPMGLLSGAVVPLGRLGARKAIMTDAAQKALAQRNYNPSTLAELMDLVSSSRYTPMALTGGALPSLLE